MPLMNRNFDVSVSFGFYSLVAFNFKKSILPGFFYLPQYTLKIFSKCLDPARGTTNQFDFAGIELSSLPLPSGIDFKCNFLHKSPDVPSWTLLGESLGSLGARQCLVVGKHCPI